LAALDKERYAREMEAYKSGAKKPVAVDRMDVDEVADSKFKSAEFLDSDDDE